MIIMEIIENAEGNEKEDVWSKPSTERLIKGGIWYNIFDIIGSITNTIFVMVISRISIEQTAALAKIDTFRAFLLAFATLGFVGAGAKFFSEYLGRNDINQAKKYAIISIKYNFIFTGIPAVIVASILVLIIPTNEVELYGFILLIFIVLFDRIRSCFDIILLGYQRYDLWSIAYFLPYCIGWLMGAVLVGPYGVLGAVISFLFASIGSCILSFIFTKKILPFPIQDLFQWKIKEKLLGKILRFNLLFSLANLAYSLLISSLLITETSILGTFGDLEVSTYYVVTGYLTLYIGIFGIVNPVNQAISEAHAMRNVNLIDNYVKTVVKFPILMAVPVTAVLLVMGGDIIEAFNGAKYVNIGTFFILVFLPGYAFGSFAAKYDNILAGIGRPECPMVPWIVGLLIASGGIFTTIWIPQDSYPFPNLFPDVSLRFAVSIFSLTIGMFVAGIWIVIITFKVFEVKVPREYITRPFIVSIIVGGLYLLVKTVWDIKSSFLNVTGPFIGNFLYISVVILVLVLIFIPLLVLFGGVSKEDAKFLLKIVGVDTNVPKILKPLIKLGQFCFKHQIWPAEETHWITKSEKIEIIEEELFSLDVSTESETIYSFNCNLQNGKQPLYQILSFLKINGKTVPESQVFHNTILAKELLKIDISVETKEVHEFLENMGIEDTVNCQFCVECYSRNYNHSNEDPIDFQQNYLKRWKAFDYRLRWYFEKEFEKQVI
jgi:O-antigen/teichoic acid export membrane protein